MAQVTNSKELFDTILASLRIPQPQGEKESIVFFLLDATLGLSRMDILTGKRLEVPTESVDQWIRRLNDNEPVQYVTSTSWFYGRRFFVDRHVLIPRPETELLVEEVVRLGKQRKSPVVLDVGTGSGCIAVTVSLELNSKVFALDLSEDALRTAGINARQLGATVSFIHGNILKIFPDIEAPDIIVSNPPYVALEEKDSMEPHVVNFEPAMALFVENGSPLIFYEVLAKHAAQRLKPGGVLITEINERFGREVVNVFESHGLTDVKVIEDLNSKDRIVSGIR